MFHQISPQIKSQMKQLEIADGLDRLDGTPRLKRLRQIPPETGRFIALMLRNAPDGQVLEIGTSAGYSTLWLSLASQARNQEITTFEILPEKAMIARNTFKLAKVSGQITLIEGDARDYLDQFENISFCFLDGEKEDYQDCYDLVIPRLCEGGLLLADNAINHATTMQAMIDGALSDNRVDSMVVPVGKGVLYCRRNAFESAQ